MIHLKVHKLFHFTFDLLPEPTYLCIHSLKDIILHLIWQCDHHHPIIFFIHNPLLIVLPDFTSFLLTKTQLSITSSHTSLSFNFSTINCFHTCPNSQQYYSYTSPCVHLSSIKLPPSLLPTHLITSSLIPNASTNLALQRHQIWLLFLWIASWSSHPSANLSSLSTRLSHYIPYFLLIYVCYH